MVVSINGGNPQGFFSSGTCQIKMDDLAVPQFQEPPKWTALGHVFDGFQQPISTSGSNSAALWSSVRRPRRSGSGPVVNVCISRNGSMWVKQCHKPPIWEWFIEPIYGDLEDGLLLF